jgi:hypothetical protein
MKKNKEMDCLLKEQSIFHADKFMNIILYL